MLEHKANKLFANAAIMSAIGAMCIFAQPAFATEIGNAGNFIPGNNGVYDITPETFDGNVGFRQYEKFNLDNGDVANLIFKQGGNNIDTFVNMVDNAININGIVNTMRDGAFYNGRAVFISPNGMVVGPTGVLNVGSLQIMTPTSGMYSTLKSNPSINNYVDSYASGQIKKDGNGVVRIDGKIFTSDTLQEQRLIAPNGSKTNIDSPGVQIHAGSINITEGAGVIAGVQNMTAINQLTEAEVLFNLLVNTDNIKTSNLLSSANIKLHAKPDYNEIGSVNIAGEVKNFGSGDLGVYSNGDINIESTGNVSSNGYIIYNNNNLVNYDAKIILKGKTISGGSAQILANSNIIVGDSDVNEQVVSAGYLGIKSFYGDIFAISDKATNGDYKTHFVSQGSLVIEAPNGAIGDADTFINVRSLAKIRASAANDIYLASINADMMIQNVSSKYGIISIIADSVVKGEDPYSILKAQLASWDYHFDAEVDGKGISLTASGGIGTADEKLNIKPTDTENFDVNMLAKTGDINVKTIAQDANVGTVIAKKGSANLLFTGNADIKEITAAKDINIDAEGKTLKMENMGSVPNTPTDYYGANSEIAPKNVKLTALDIANGKTTNAHSEVVVTNTRVKPDADSDTPDITIAADNVYIDGKHFVRDDSNKVVVEGNSYVRFADLNDDRTNPVQNANDNITSVGIKAVRPDDVVALGGLEDVRNYYYEDELPEVVDNSSKDDEGKRTYQRKSDDDDVAIIDKRKYMRFSIADNKNVVELESNPVIDSLIDISRGGVAIKHHKSLKVGDIVPIQLSFGGLDIDTNVKIVTATDVRAGAEFVDLDHATANKLLYMNILLQEAYGGNGLIKIK